MVHELSKVEIDPLTAGANQIGQILVGKRKVDPQAAVLLDPVFLPELEEHPNQALLDTQGCQVLHPSGKAFFPQGEAPKHSLQKLGMLPKEERKLVPIDKANAAVVDGLG